MLLLLLLRRAVGCGALPSWLAAVRSHAAARVAAAEARTPLAPDACRTPRRRTLHTTTCCAPGDSAVIALPVQHQLSKPLRRLSTQSIQTLLLPLPLVRALPTTTS